MNKPMLTVLVFWFIIASLITLLILWPKVVAITLLVICAAIVIPFISMLLYQMAKDAVND